ncbi:MAG: ThuA domain-containing protein [Acidobacteria bacterium]|nr:ThuA domain-containing protein [Acidobacteriota bacterium]
MLGAIIIAALVLFQTSLYAQAPAPKLQALIITGQNGHDWRAVTPLLRKALEDTGRFEVRVTEEFRGAGPETLAPYDVVVLNYYERRNPALRWGERADNALLEYVRNGRGVVIYHFSVAAFDGWVEYEKMCAGNWRPNQGHHSAAHDFIVDIRDPEHPITQGFKAKLLQAKDELYANLRWQPAETYHVLATAYDDHSLYGGKARQPIPGPGLDHPMLWTVQYGQGRVFATALGHDGPAVQTPTFVATFVRGTEWAATGKVTIPVPPELAR